MTWTLNGTVVEQTGTETSLSGSEALAGVTLNTIGTLLVYDFGTLSLSVGGTLTINGDDASPREMLAIGQAGATQDETDVDVISGGTLNVGFEQVQGSGVFSSAAFFPDIYEKASIDFSDGNGNGVDTTGTSRAFLAVRGGGTLNWYGNINCTGGIGFDGQGNSGASNCTVFIKNGVYDTRRTTERGSSTADNFIYMYTNDFTMDGLTLLSTETTTLGQAILLLEAPVLFKNFKVVMSTQAIGGSSSGSNTTVYDVEDYAGIIGDGTTGIDFRSATNSINNTNQITFINSELGSTLNMNTQDPGNNQIFARQQVTASVLNSVGGATADSVIGTENKNSVITFDLELASTAQGTMTLPTQPTNGDTFTLDAKTYTLQTTLTNVDGNINIGANVAATQANIMNAINLTGTPGTDYATAMTIHPTLSAGTFASDDMILTAKTAGAAGNDILLVRDFTSINNLFDARKMGIVRAGSDLNTFNLGRILLTEWNPDGGTPADPPVPVFNNPSNTDDDLWSFYVYSYLYLDRNRLDVLLRGAGGTSLEFIVPTDLKVTELTRATVDAYTDIRNMDRLYDRSKSFKVDNVGVPALDTPVVISAGNIMDFGALNLVIDGDVGTEYNIAGSTITINPSYTAEIERVGATESISSGVDDEITISFPAGSADGHVAYLAVGHSESEDNAWNTPSGWVIPTGLTEVQTGGTVDSTPGVSVFRRVLSGDSGSVTITNAGTNTSGIVAQMIVYRNVDNTTPEDVNPTTATGASGDPDPGSITPINTDSMILTFGFQDGGDKSSPTPPTNYTAVLDTATTDGEAS